MGKYIHPSAKISESAQIHDDVFIGENVEIGDETFVGKGVVIEKNTKIGRRNKIYPYVVIGTPPQHIDYKDEETFVHIGDENIIREFATIHRGTVQGGRITRIGSRNYIMAYSHVAHDCVVGSECVLTSFVALAGHTEVGDKTVFGGYSGTHQFVKVGKLVMVGAASFPAKNVPPFLLVAGVETRIVGLNLIGLKRAGVPSSEMEKLKECLRIYLDTSLKIEKAEQKIRDVDLNSPYVREFADFIRENLNSKRGFLRKSEKDERSLR